MTILVVDDELLIRKVIREYLESENYKVLEAENGLDALRVLSSNKVNLIILDIMMPKMDGFACLEEIRKTKDIPVIMLSAMKEETDKLNSFNLGVDDYDN